MVRGVLEAPHMEYLPRRKMYVCPPLGLVSGEVNGWSM